MTNSSSPTVKSAASRVFAPLMRLLLQRGIRFPEIQLLMKTLLVSEAEHLALRLRLKPTDSRVSILTGLQRKDVKALRQDHNSQLPGSIGPIPRLIAMWTADSVYQDEDGNPASLPRLRAASGPSFEEFCQTTTRDIHPRTLLDELIRQGAATLNNETDEVSLAAASYVPSGDNEVLLHYFGMNLGDHAAAAATNVLAAPELGPFYERAVHYNQLSPESLDELETLARSIQSKALAEINEHALRLQRLDASKPTATGRFRCGAFVYFKAGGNDR